MAGVGLRTNALVATGAALFVLLSAYGFATTGVRGVITADLTVEHRDDGQLESRPSSAA